MLITLAFLFTFCTHSLFAQWEPDVRLTNFADASYTSFNNARNVASNGNTVHVVWYDNRIDPINYEIYYKRSTNAGVSWGADIRLTNNTGDSHLPSVSVSGSVVHVAWQDRRDGNFEIYYKRSTDEGASWGADVRLTNASFESWHPSVSVTGLNVHIVWQDRRDVDDEIYYKRSTDGGLSWEADIRLTNNAAISAIPSVSVSGLLVHTVWSEFRNGNFEIYYKRSSDGGASWGLDTRLTTNSSVSNSACVSASDSVVHVTWTDRRDGNHEIYYKRSSDGGLNWGTDTRLTINSSYSDYPSVTVSGSIVHIVWQDSRNPKDDIYYKCSTDGGVSWESDTRLTVNVTGAGAWNPSVSVSGPAVHVVWNDYRIGSEIWYKRNPTGSRIPSTLNLTAFIEGFYNPVSNSMISDTAYIYLRNASSPYAIIDSAKSTINSSGTGTFNFNNSSNGVNYFIVARHRNSIETWSAAGKSICLRSNDL
ncbi:MAG: sialidase family protein [Ignavibacteria bacterium]